MPQPLPRAWRRQQQALDTEKVARIVAETGATEEPRNSAGVTAAGDGRRVRGLPAIGKGVTGAIRDTRPGDGLFQ